MKESIMPDPLEEEEVDPVSARALDGAAHLRLYYNRVAAKERALPCELRVVVSIPNDEWEATRADPRGLLAICMDGLIAAIRAEEPVGADLNRAIDRAASLMKQRLRLSDTSSVLVVSQRMLDNLGEESMH